MDELKFNDIFRFPWNQTTYFSMIFGLTFDAITSFSYFSIMGGTTTFFIAACIYMRYALYDLYDQLESFDRYVSSSQKNALETKILLKKIISFHIEILR